MKNISNKPRLLAVATALLLMSGCVTTYEDRAKHQVHMQSDFNLLEEKSRQMNGRVEGVEMQLEDVQRTMDELRRETSGSGQAMTDATSSRLDALETKLSNLEVNRERDRQEIIDKLTEKITAIMNTRPSTVPVSAPRTTGPRPTTTSEYGYEHQVQPGETLSQIAASYGVSMQSIIDANTIQNANDVKAGTKLFVPE